MMLPDVVKIPPFQKGEENMKKNVEHDTKGWSGNKG